MPTRWWNYVERVAGDSQQKDIARHAGIDKSHISLWKTRDQIPQANFVVKFARAYDRNVIEALVEAEYITPDEAELREVRVGDDDRSPLELLEVVAAWIRRQQDSARTP